MTYKCGYRHINNPTVMVIMNTGFAKLALGG